MTCPGSLAARQPAFAFSDRESAAPAPAHCTAPPTAKEPDPSLISPATAVAVAVAFAPALPASLPKRRPSWGKTRRAAHRDVRRPRQRQDAPSADPRDGRGSGARSAEGARQGALDQPSAVVKRFFWLPSLCASKEALLSSRRLIEVTRPQGRKPLLDTAQQATPKRQHSPQHYKRSTCTTATPRKSTTPSHPTPSLFAFSLRSGMLPLPVLADTVRREPINTFPGGGI